MLSTASAFCCWYRPFLSSSMHWSLEFATFRRPKLSPGSQTHRLYPPLLTHSRPYVEMRDESVLGKSGSHQFCCHCGGGLLLRVI